MNTIYLPRCLIAYHSASYLNDLSWRHTVRPRSWIPYKPPPCWYTDAALWNTWPWWSRWRSPASDRKCTSLSGFASATLWGCRVGLWRNFGRSKIHFARWYICLHRWRMKLLMGSSLIQKAWSCYLWVQNEDRLLNWCSTSYRQYLKKIRLKGTNTK